LGLREESHQFGSGDFSGLNAEAIAAADGNAMVLGAVVVGCADMPEIALAAGATCDALAFVLRGGEEGNPAILACDVDITTGNANAEADVGKVFANVDHLGWASCPSLGGLDCPSM